MAANVGEIIATTLRNVQPGLADNIFEENVVLNHLKASGGYKSEPGGRRIDVPLEYAKNTNVTAYDTDDTLTHAHMENFDAATYDWAHYDVGVQVYRTEILQNSGRYAISNLVTAKIKNAKNSLASRLGADIFSGAGSASKEIVGLEDMAGATGVIGGIDSAVETYWQSTVDSTAEALTIEDVRHIKNSSNLGQGGKKVSLIVTSLVLYEKLMSLYTSNLQMNVVRTKEQKRLGDAGFENMGLDGVPVAFDEHCADTDMFMINPENFKLYYHKDDNFEVMKKADPTDKHVKITHISWTGQTVTNRRASLGRLSGKTA